jgi:outer membrane lipoprotein carrier protein
MKPSILLPSPGAPPYPRRERRHHRTPRAGSSRRIRHIALLSAVALGTLMAGVTVPSALEAQDPTAIMERAAERYRAMASFCAEFRQEVRNDLMRQTTRSRGELCQARPDRFEMRFSDPEGDRIVADGEFVWVYFPSVDDGQVFRSTFAATGGRFDLHREFLSDPGRRYAPTLEGTEVVGGRQAHVLSLEPLVDSPYLRARIWVATDDPVILKLEIVEEEGIVRELELFGLELNAAIPGDRFRFVPPPGVQVITR